MPTTHKLHLVVDSTVGEAEGRRMLVDQIIAMFPDAIVDGMADIAMHGNDMIVKQRFRSPMFDRIADNVALATVAELDAMIMELSESVLLKGQARRIYKKALEDAKTRIALTWGVM